MGSRSKYPESDDEPEDHPARRPESIAGQDTAATSRDVCADARDRAADERDREADRREADADQREQEADVRERQADVRESALYGVPRVGRVPASDVLGRSGAALQRASDAVTRAERRIHRADAERRRTRSRLDYDHPHIVRPNAEMVVRIRQANNDARCMAGWLAAAADDVAKTLDHVAATREARAQQLGCPESDHCRESASRARRKADAERVESRRMREQWDLSPG